MRDFLHSEIASMHGLSNVPENPDLAIAAGKRLCEELLEPLQATFGRIANRSAYRSPAVNTHGNRHNWSCASNKRNLGRHIWDRLGPRGMGAMACIVVPWLLDHLDEGAFGRRWLGGFTTICPIANSNSFRNFVLSTSHGKKAPSAQYLALYLHADI
jgi:hypothetical protein